MSVTRPEGVLPELPPPIQPVTDLAERLDDIARDPMALHRIAISLAFGATHGEVAVENPAETIPTQPLSELPPSPYGSHSNRLPHRKDEDITTEDLLARDPELSIILERLPRSMQDDFLAGIKRTLRANRRRHNW